MSATFTAEILANDSATTYQDLLDFSSHMNAQDEDVFWAKVNEIRGYQH